MVKQTLCAPARSYKHWCGTPSQHLSLPEPLLFSSKTSSHFPCNLHSSPPTTHNINPPLLIGGTDRRYLCKTLSIQVLCFQHERLYTFFRIQGTWEFNEVLII